MIATPRSLFEWALRTRSLELGKRTLLVGIINVTPDSFSEHGECFAPDAATERALRFLDEGADILDIGGESTRPGDRPEVSASEEQDRVLPVIERVLKERPSAVLSIDTYKAETARAAVAAGVEIVNDVSAFLWDQDMATACVELACGVVLMHTRGTMREWQTQPRLAADAVVPMVIRGLGARLAEAMSAGVRWDRIVLDPGFGFGKIGEENYSLLTGFGELRSLSQPLMAGPSRKSFLGKTLERLEGREVPAGERDVATLAAITAAIFEGAHLVRVHEIKAAREVAAIADAIRESAAEEPESRAQRRI